MAIKKDLVTNSRQVLSYHVINPIYNRLSQQVEVSIFSYVDKSDRDINFDKPALVSQVTLWPKQKDYSNVEIDNDDTDISAQYEKAINDGIIPGSSTLDRFKMHMWWSNKVLRPQLIRDRSYEFDPDKSYDQFLIDCYNIIMAFPEFEDSSEI